MPQNLDVLDDGKFEDEPAAVERLLESVPLDGAARREVVSEAAALVEGARSLDRRKGVVASFLQEFSLSSPEGTALMCLAEALLRTPDEATRDRLIAEKIASADWSSHLGQSDSFFVNASTWGLMLTGRLVEVDAQTQRDPHGFLKRLTTRMGEPVIRRAVAAAIGIMGEQFVLGRTIDAALSRARKENLLCSFDMLGEGARTNADAIRLFDLYAHAIEAVGSTANGVNGAGPHASHGVSVKLSALSPRYDALHEARVMEELYPRLKILAMAAARHHLDLAIDAEEADRLTLSLRLVDRLVREEELRGWQGLGVVVQAYQKRALRVLDVIEQMARDSGRRIMVRLVKGAYWDTEIKRAQVAGMPDYPVYTTKAATDLSYLVCARKLIAASPHLFAQFATHNAHTLAAIRYLAADAGVDIEFQRLHGMGDTLYAAAERRYGVQQIRTYAPVGGHEDLLPYLVRRLLENGANSSFVHLLLDESVPPLDVVQDPVDKVAAGFRRHPGIPSPTLFHGSARVAARGRDFTASGERNVMQAAITRVWKRWISAAPVIDGMNMPGHATPIRNPADPGHTVGDVVLASLGDVDDAIVLARRAQPAWDQAGGGVRAEVLRAMGDTLETNLEALVPLLIFEAGKTWPDAVAEVREAVDFCRYYAVLAQREFAAPRVLQGPVGETNHWRLGGRGVFACISPWNFPLAIFTGQIAAALAAGNAVLAKPAEQTPLIATQAVRLFHAAGLDPKLLGLLPGTGEQIGHALVTHSGIDGVAFTGGIETAALINRTLAERGGPIIPFIAETGGLNAMFVDTTALKEQVVDDVMTSAFGSAGQRCSALRVLFIPEDTADEILVGLQGALENLVIGDPADPATDIGPVIDGAALSLLEQHVIRLESEARIVARYPKIFADGYFFRPLIAEIPSPDWLRNEVFGPILHVFRYKPEDLPRVARAFAASGYGLTLGIHSRIAAFVHDVRSLVPAGNVYVNRSMIGAVVGVQPFGGVGLSGTGPKAGGPHALHRYAQEQVVTVNIMAAGGDSALLQLE